MGNIEMRYRSLLTEVNLYNTVSKYA
jgi:hypothetical protein